MENKLSIYTFTVVDNGKTVDVYFMNDKDATEHAERLAAVNGDVAISKENSPLLLVKPLEPYSSLLKIKTN